MTTRDAIAIVLCAVAAAAGALLIRPLPALDRGDLDRARRLTGRRKTAPANGSGSRRTA